MSETKKTAPIRDRVPSQERTWKDYVRHTDKCASWKCASCGGPSDLLTHNYGAIGGRPPDHDPILQPCDCGLDALLASPCQQGQGWQPIETAPKDGTPILLFRHGQSVVQGAWNPGGAFLMEHWSTPTGLFDPTHWMPMMPLPVSDPLPAGEQK